MGVEALMAKETVGLLTRRPEKFKNIAGQYLVSLTDCEVSRTGRAAYFFIRYMDDLLDGDRILPSGDEPINHIGAIRSQIETGVYTDGLEIMELARYSLDALSKKARPDDNPKQDVLDVIDVMVFDNQRRQERETLTEKQLDDYYRKTFSPIHNLMLIGLQSQLRAQDIPEFSLCQGRIYSAEHLKFDWQTGIINIPEEILKTAGLTSDSAYEDVNRSGIVKSWTQRELQKSKAELLSTQTRFPLSEKLTYRIYNHLTRSMLKFIDRY